jgi:hypothetical protein
LPEAPVPTVNAFPANFIWVISQALDRVPYVDNVVRRPIRFADANLTASVWASEWTPRADGYEIGQEEPTLARYPFTVEYIVKGMGDESDLHNIHSVGSKYIRAMMYRDEALGVQLHQLSEVLAGTREQVKRIVINRQRFVQNVLRSTMVYLSRLEGHIETETQKV